MPKDVRFLECSDKVGAALGPDVLKSVKHLVPDILASLPLLLYQGKASSPHIDALSPQQPPQCPACCLLALP